MTKVNYWRPKSKRRKPIKRTTGDHRKTKESLEREANVEIDAIFAEFAGEIEALRGNGQSGVLYGRHSSIHQDSIPAQIRSLLTKAIKMGIFISRENVFFDVAVRGSKQQRELTQNWPLLTCNFVAAFNPQTDTTSTKLENLT